MAIEVVLLVVAVLGQQTLHVNGQSYIPRMSIEKSDTPGDAVGIDGLRDGFKSVYSSNGYTKYIQTVDGIPVYGTGLVTHSDEDGKIDEVQGYISRTASYMDMRHSVDTSEAIDRIKYIWYHEDRENELDIDMEEPKLFILAEEYGDYEDGPWSEEMYSGGKPNGWRTLGGKPNGWRTLGGKPNGWRTLGGKPNGWRTLGGKPNGWRTLGGKPNGWRTLGGKPNGWRTLGGKPNGWRTLGGKPNGWRTLGGKPNGWRTLGGKPNGWRTLGGKPNGWRTLGGKPNGWRTLGGKPNGWRTLDSDCENDTSACEKPNGWRDAPLLWRDDLRWSSDPVWSDDRVRQDKLVWRVSYTVNLKNDVEKGAETGPTPANIYGFVNAQSGEIEASWDQIQYANMKKIEAVIGNEKVGKDKVKIKVEKKDENCKHRDAKRRIEVFDLNNKRGSTDSTTSKFKCSDAKKENWDKFEQTGGYSPRNEVYRNSRRFIDMWDELVPEAPRPHENNSSFLNFYVHYGQNHEGASFTGEVFIFGDGGNKQYPATSLDIVCHEIGHAVTLWHGAKLVYHGQSGAINEAYSDIVGESCDIHYHKKSNALIAEDVMRPGAPPALRSMCNPPSIGNSIDHIKDYHPANDVHSNSGIYNKAWCILKKEKGWSYRDLFKVFTDANLIHWTPTSSLHCGACGVMSAAKGRKKSTDDVVSAFAEVGVSCDNCWF